MPITSLKLGGKLSCQVCILRQVLCMPGWPQTCYVPQDVLELLILQSLHLKCQNYSGCQPSLYYFFLRNVLIHYFCLRFGPTTPEVCSFQDLTHDVIWWQLPLSKPFHQFWISLHRSGRLRTPIRPDWPQSLRSTWFCLLNAGIKGICHCFQPWINFCFWFFQDRVSSMYPWLSWNSLWRPG